MEQVLNKLAEIELTANRIMEEADNRKKALSEDMEKQCREFDKYLTEETTQKIETIRRQLELDKDAQLKALSAQTDSEFKRLDAYYQKYHKQLAEELFRKIIDF